MKRRVFYLAMIGILLFTGMKTQAHHQDDFPGIKKYENISVFSGKGVTLSWMADDKVAAEKILREAENSNLIVISRNDDLKIMGLKDERENIDILIQGSGELLNLAFDPKEVKSPHRLLEFKVEDGVISRDQYLYIENLLMEIG